MLREAAKGGRGSCACRSCSARGTSASGRTRRSSTWPSRAGADHGRPVPCRARRRGRRRRPRLRAAGRGRLPQQPGRDRRRRDRRGDLPEDAHPGRPVVLREVLLHAGRPGVPGLRHPGGAHRRPHLLGPVVSRGRAAHGARRGGGPVLPDGHRLASPREGGARRGAQLDAWRTVQRGHAIANGVYVAAVNRVGHEAPGRRGAGIEFWGSSFICDPQGAVLAEASPGPRGDPLRRGRPRPPRGRPAELAVPARPPDRRLRRDHAPLPGRGRGGRGR